MARPTTNRLTQAAQALKKLYRDERGAEGLEKLLIIGAIVIPLLGLLVAFRKELVEWTSDMWGDVTSDSDNDYNPDSFE
jgi:Flp pilus assembly pilin Flp